MTPPNAIPELLQPEGKLKRRGERTPRLVPIEGVTTAQTGPTEAEGIEPMPTLADFLSSQGVVPAESDAPHLREERNVAVRAAQGFARGALHTAASLLRRSTKEFGWDYMADAEALGKAARSIPSYEGPRTFTGAVASGDIDAIFTSAVETLPYMVATIGAGIGATLATGNPWAGRAAAWGVASAVETDNHEQELLAAGVPAYEANQTAQVYGAIAGAIELLGVEDIMRVAGGKKALLRLAYGKLVKKAGKGAAQGVGISLKNMGMQALSNAIGEGLEEIAQKGAAAGVNKFMLDRGIGPGGWGQWVDEAMYEFLVAGAAGGTFGGVAAVRGEVARAGGERAAQGAQFEGMEAAGEAQAAEREQLWRGVENAGMAYSPEGPFAPTEADRAAAYAEELKPPIIEKTPLEVGAEQAATELRAGKPEASVLHRDAEAARATERAQGLREKAEIDKGKQIDGILRPLYERYDKLAPNISNRFRRTLEPIIKQLAGAIESNDPAKAWEAGQRFNEAMDHFEAARGLKPSSVDMTATKPEAPEAPQAPPAAPQQAKAPEAAPEAVQEQKPPEPQVPVRLKPMAENLPQPGTRYEVAVETFHGKPMGSVIVEVDKAKIGRQAQNITGDNPDVGKPFVVARARVIERRGDVGVVDNSVVLNLSDGTIDAGIPSDAKGLVFEQTPEAVEAPPKAGEKKA
ncbi:MAG TPA: hypothetical protein VM031_00495, partial [Phycisphaerae bacterium]|nr:hypothetical protein [Phycisphaerae bacterium]